MGEAIDLPVEEHSKTYTGVEFYKVHIEDLPVRELEMKRDPSARPDSRMYSEKDIAEAEYVILLPTFKSIPKRSEAWLTCRSEPCPVGSTWEAASSEHELLGH